jgi:hypothetical protein
MVEEHLNECRRESDAIAGPALRQTSYLAVPFRCSKQVLHGHVRMDF